MFAIVALSLIWLGSWVAGWFDLHIGVGWRVLASFLVALVVATVVGLRRLRASRAARAFEAEILKQSEQQAAYARPDRRAEILELRQQMEQGIAALRSSKLGGGKGSQALYALPWYMIIGPPGSGKTTALKKSGLNFAFNPEQGGMRGVGGTRNCDWWFTNDAILLDTAGRYATEQDDLEEWGAFLNLLKRFRSKRPLNGVLVAVSVTDLIDAREDQIIEMARRLRARVDELMTRLEMVIPVYVMFTKTDLIGGFVEMFGDLRMSERDQIVGATFPLGKGEPNVAAEFTREFEQLVKVLHAAALRRIGHSRSFPARQKILQFPVEFQTLQENLTTFTAQLFEPNRFQGTPVLRGFYFTSGTQEGNPVSRMIGRMASAFGLPAAPGAELQQLEAKSYFVTDLFRRVVFPDANVAAHTDAQRRRRAILRAGFAAGCLFVALSIVVPAAVTFGRNLALVNRVSEVTRDASAIQWTDKSPLTQKVARLDKLRQVLTQLEGWEKDGAPYGMRWGMYAGSGLVAPVRAVYVEQMHKGFTVPTRPELEAQLRAFQVAGADDGNFIRQYDQLKLYLMLGEVGHLDVAWASEEVARYWAKALRSAEPDKDAALLVPHARAYLELVKSNQARPWDHDSQLIDAARKKLLETPRLDRLYSNLVRDAHTQVVPVRLDDYIYGPSAKYITAKKGVEVSGAYKKDGYNLIKKVLVSQRDQLEREVWVLAEGGGEVNEKVTDKMMDDLSDRYFTRYQESWRELFLDIQVASPKNDAEAKIMYEVLTEPDWPYLRLIRGLAEHSRIHVEEGEMSRAARKVWEQRKRQMVANVSGKLRLGRAGVQLGPQGSSQPPAAPLSPMEGAFLPLLQFGAPPRGKSDATPQGLSDYVGFLTALQGKLLDQDAPMATKREMAPDYETALRGTMRLLETQDAYTRPMLEPLLVQPLLRSGVRRPSRY
ncbi:MAG: type VI secretion system membrane subunit TssM [Polyangiaceae bacterium]|nr:type VI secretion system membrane subunit TssM [Polyangiaceae bacterium]MCW5789220.1 type VI secretion system membrane subunit TssM [Polyangiaceae bacterium]